MCKRNNSALFFTCTLIEQLGRVLRQTRGNIAGQLGERGVKTLYDHADVLHCEPIEKVAEDVIGEFGLSGGGFDNVAAAKYAVPDVWTMGKVYARLIEDTSGEDDVIQTLMAVYASWADAALSDYNSSFYYQSRDYIAESYKQGYALEG